MLASLENHPTCLIGKLFTAVKSADMFHSKGYKEEKDLVVLNGADESSQSHEEQKDPDDDDAPYHLETRDQPEPLSPGSDANHQHAHHLQEDRQEERDKDENTDLTVKTRYGCQTCA